MISGDDVDILSSTARRRGECGEIETTESVENDGSSGEWSRARERVTGAIHIKDCQSQRGKTVFPNGDALNISLGIA